MIWRLDGRWSDDGLARFYAIRDGIAYVRVEGERVWRVSHRIGGKVGSTRG